MTITYTPREVCARKMTIEVEGDTVRSLEITGGCPGNLEAISRLVTGMKVEDVIDRLRGIPCGLKATSCPDQLARALEQARGEGIRPDREKQPAAEKT